MMLLLIVAAIIALCAFDAWAQTGAIKAPFDPALLVTYTWVVVLAGLGGVANFVRKVRRGEARAFNLAELLGELVVSASAGVITFYLCTWAQVNEWLAAALIGISGHGGSRFFFMAERQVEHLYERLFGTHPIGK